MYVALKHIHLVTIALSATLLSIRFVLMMMNSPKRNNRFLKVFPPHIVDTALLVSGIALIFITGFIPFTDAAPWLTNKITCVLAYIALGFFSLNLRKTTYRYLAFSGALGWLVMAANIAVSKSPTLFG
ncbi:LOW QUALITY PROTEIN: SirB2 protein [Vibrio sp. JCM 18904]|nr:LOW QUALITY PROTEIN: SirB2 protein [Vibrio sp. JCM 18904]